MRSETVSFYPKIDVVFENFDLVSVNYLVSAESERNLYVFNSSKTDKIS